MLTITCMSDDDDDDTRHLYAVAENDADDGTSTTVETAGRYGVASDSRPDYFDEVYAEEVATLRGRLVALGFTVEDIDKAVAAAIGNEQ